MKEGNGLIWHMMAAAMTRYLRLIKYFLACAWAAGAMAVAGATATAADATPQQQIREMQVLEDASKQLDLQQAIRSPDWQRVESGIVSGGYSKSAFWIRFKIGGLNGQSAVLTVLPAFLDDVRFYLPDALIQPEETASSLIPANVKGWWLSQQGDFYPRSAGSREWRAANVDLHDAGGAENAYVYLRLQTGSASILYPQVFSSQDFADLRRNEYLVFGMAIGTTFLLALVVLVLLVMYRERVFGYYLMFAADLAPVFPDPSYSQCSARSFTACWRAWAA